MKEVRAGEAAPSGPPGSSWMTGWPGRLSLLGLLALLSLAPDPTAALPRFTYFFRDLSITFYPVREFAARELQAGRLPVWNPYIFEGSFAVPYFHLLDLLLVARFDPSTFSFLLSLQFPIAALSAYALLRDLGASRAGAFVAGAIFSLGGLCRSSANLYVFLQVLAVAPLIILTLRRAAHRGGRYVAAAGATLAVGLTTLAVEFVGQAALLGVVLALLAAPLRTAWPRLALAGLLGVGLSGIALLPLLGLLQETVRGAGLTSEVALGHSTPPVALLQVLIPDLFGSLSDPVQVFWGRAFFPRLPYFLSLYLGPLALALAWAGLPELPRRARIAVAALGVLGVWFALGRAGGLAPLLMPLLRVVRYPSKAWLLPYLAVTVCAGLGAAALFEGRRWRRFVLACLGLAAATSLVLAVLAVAPERVRQLADLPVEFLPGIRGSLLLGTATATLLALVGAGLGALAQARLVQPTLGCGLLAGAIVLDLVRAHAGLNPQADPSFFRLVPELQAERLADLAGGRVFTYPLDTSPAFLRLLASRPPNLRLLSFYLNRQLLGPYLNSIDRVRVPDDKDLTSFTPRPPELRPEDYDPARVGRLLGWMRQAAVQRVLTLDHLDHPELRLRTSVAVGPPGLAIQVYELARPAPFAYLACAPRRARSPDEALALALQPGFDLERDVVFEGEVAASPGCTSGQVLCLRDLPASRTYAVRADGPGFLVERENFARGWKAEVDGRPARVLRANGKHRAVAVPEGAHEVVLRYEAPGLGAGALVTLLSVVVMAWFFVRPPLRSDRGGAEDEPRADETPGR